MNSTVVTGPVRSFAGFLTKVVVVYSVFGDNPSTGIEVEPFNRVLPVLHPGPSGLSLGQILYSITAVSCNEVPVNEVTSSKLIVAFVPLTSLASTLTFSTGGPK